MLIVVTRGPRSPASAWFDALLLREEGEGILRWAVEGGQAYAGAEDFGVIQLTDAQSRRVDDLLSESDSVRSFVRECVVACHGGEVTIQDLAAAYRDYCEARDGSRCASASFRQSCRTPCWISIARAAQ
jgi:phage/plasmid-associated DNA primase